MSNNRYPPAYLRYLKARLMNLARPSFWGTAIFLSVVGLLIHEYWNNPDIFSDTYKNIQTSSDSLGNSLSDEDRAIAADIDSLPLLFGQNDTFSLPAPTTESTDNKTKNALVEAASKSQSTGQKPNPGIANTSNIATAQAPNLFVSQTQNTLRFGANDNNQLLGLKLFNPAEQSAAISGIPQKPETGLTNQFNNNQNSKSDNNLPTNFNQVNNQNTSSLNSAGSSPTTLSNSPYYSNLVQTAPTTLIPSQTTSPNTNNFIPSNNYSNINNSQRPLPNSGINTSTNYLQPNTVNPQSSTYYNRPVPSSTGLNTNSSYVQSTTIQPGVYNNLNNGQVVPNQVPNNSSVITGTSPIIGPYNLSNSRPRIQTNLEPLVPNNYGNSVWQQQNQLPQSNSPYGR